MPKPQNLLDVCYEIATRRFKDLERLLEDRNKFVRMNAAMALSGSGTRRSLMALKAAYNREAERDVKELLAETVRDLEKRIR